MPFHLLAVKAVVQTPGVVALRIAFPIVEVLPALQRLGAVLPGIVEVEGAVPSVPATGVVVALPIADLVPSIPRANLYLTFLLDFRWGDVLADAAPEIKIQDVAVQAIEVCRATALVIWGSFTEKFTGAPVVTRV